MRPQTCLRAAATIRHNKPIGGWKTMAGSHSLSQHPAMLRSLVNNPPLLRLYVQQSEFLFVRVLRHYGVAEQQSKRINDYGPHESMLWRRLVLVMSRSETRLTNP
ncbi:hypothetical protein MPL3365_170162 [Mesorhizobium plurifarium]|uniref:Uncharacterized protein n=1 Tax=Mesorhizobium plurifarium TaxID=69974 RepID=A0A090G5Q1_MESPL|nr:hypothetical protein MPL3365_170162 [Mesorhizobium plurifarium]